MMPDRLQTFRNLVQDSVLDWQANVCNPYIEAYDKAYTNYKDSFDKQKESDKARAEMFVAIISILPGSSLMATAGTSSLRVIANRGALRLLAVRSATKTLATYNAVLENASAKFAVGKVLDIVKDETGKKIKDAATRTMSNSRDLISTSPLSRDKQLNSWLLNHQLLANDAAQAIESSRSMSNDAKDKAYLQLRLAPIANRPQGKIVPVELALKLELGLYMIWILDSDELISQTMVATEYFAGEYISEPIDALPSSPQYPKPAKNQWIGVRRPGGDVEDRIDELHKKLFKEKFYKSNWLGKDDTKKTQEVQKSERTLQRLSDQTQPLSALGLRS
jgi:hypothetical protein